MSKGSHGLAIKLHEQAKKLDLCISWNIDNTWAVLDKGDASTDYDTINLSKVLFSGCTLEELDVLLKGVTYGKDKKIKTHDYA